MKKFLFPVAAALWALSALAENPPAPTAPAAPSPTVAEQDDDAPAPAAPKPDPAAAQYWQAIKLLGSKKPAEQEAGRTALQAAADLEYLHAQVQLAQCHLTGGYGFKKDERRAINLLRLAAERGSGFAQVSLGACYASGTGIRTDETKAAEWLRAALAPAADFSRPTPPADFEFAADTETDGVVGQQAADPANGARASAHFLLGVLLAKGKKDAEAQEHFVAAASAGPDGRDGVFQAAVTAALNFAFGHGTPRDLDKAHAMLERSRHLTARLGVNLIHNYSTLKLVDEFAIADLEQDADAAARRVETGLQFKIAAQFADKKSKDYNPAEAARWYELAAQNGEGWAMVQLAFLHADGSLGKTDLTKAFEWLEKAGSGDKPKDFLGAANLALCYANGIGTTKDSAKAGAIFQKLKENDLVCHLGSIGQAPTALITRDQLIALMQTWAKKKSDPHAQFLWGLLLMDARYEHADFDDGLRWIKKGAKAKDGPALRQLGYLHERLYWRLGETREQGLKEAAECYRQATEANDVPGMNNYALLLSDGLGVPRDTERAETLYLRALQLLPDYTAAHNNLAVLYRSRLNTMQTPGQAEQRAALVAKVLEHFEAAAAGSEAVAAKNLGDIYREGEIAPRDYRRAYGYYEQAAGLGLPMVHLTLGDMHELGQGVPVTLTEAAYHYRLAALAGNFEALRRLVNFYIEGRGVSTDLDRAMFWLRRLALFHPGALPTACDILIHKGDFENALKILRQLANSDNDVLAGYANNRLSECYLAGWGVKPNPAKAKKYFDVAVKKGDSEALTKLGMDLMKDKKAAEGVAMFERAAAKSRDANFYLGQLYYFGTDVPKDEAKALAYLHTAAERGQAGALYFLAGLTFNGAAGAPSLEEAVRFATQAESLGHPKAAALRTRLEQRLKENARPTEQSARARAS
ncbi:MAG: sel1 repeat family protein [Candidatus Didemnitutus sp.]|nr:sel1 repeat family protein [Candidatus Didemnitutus sp.]